jgi:hypothetical protein
VIRFCRQKSALKWSMNDEFGLFVTAWKQSWALESRQARG